jgi:ribonuclease HII
MPERFGANNCTEVQIWSRWRKAGLDFAEKACTNCLRLRGIWAAEKMPKIESTGSAQRRARRVLKSRPMGRLCSARYEREARQHGWQRVAGLDEVGRGSLFGPVLAGAVVLNPRRRIVGLDDSKKLTHERRAELADRIREHALAWATAEIAASRIDAWNIYQASRQAMVAAVSQLFPLPDYLLLDAMEIDLPIEQKALIHGDARSVSIAAASILAKVERDRRMEEYDQLYPQYGLAQNKGYATQDHLDALRRHGPSPLHRFSYAPVRAAGCWAAGATQTPLPLDGLLNIIGS